MSLDGSENLEPRAIEKTGERLVNQPRPIRGRSAPIKNHH